MLIYNLEHIEKSIESYLPKCETYIHALEQAMSEAVKNGGKRIRPILMYEVYRLFAGNEDIAEVAPYMAAMEMIHTSSLIHDDLPCMDNDMLRRGKPTTWVTYGEDMAVLAGDGLIVEAFHVVSRHMTGLDDLTKIKRALYANEILAYHTGVDGMIGGQALDVEKTGSLLNTEELDFIYRKKTGALLKASMSIGAVIGGACDEEIKIIEDMAHCIGMAFQIRDDILDEISTSEELGKPIHSDEKNQKSTYVSLFGLEAAKQRVEEYSHRAKTLLQGIETEKNKEILLDIIDYLIDRNK